MASKMSNFDRAVSQIRNAIKRRIRNNQTVSSLDVAKVAPTYTGGARGAVVRAAFLDLQKEGVITVTNESVYNPRIRHRVAVYRRNSA